MEPQIGTVVADRFDLEAVAGRGGMGTVYRARDRHSGRTAWATAAWIMAMVGRHAVTRRFLARLARARRSPEGERASMRAPRASRILATARASSGVPENASTLALARELLGETPRT